MHVCYSISDPKVRTIHAAHFRDRVVHHAICHVLEPYFERFFIYDSYACRKGKGTHAALARAKEFCKQYPLYFKSDIRKYFESIPHQGLRDCLASHLKDCDLLWLLDVIIASSATPVLQPNVDGRKG